MKTPHASPRYSVFPVIAALSVAIIGIVGAFCFAQWLSNRPPLPAATSVHSQVASLVPEESDDLIDKSANQVSAPAGTNNSTLWTVDSEQRVAAAEEFQAVDDRTTELRPEEMPAYWRVMSWVEQQPIEQLRLQPSVSSAFNQFLQQPDSMRGQLVKLDLNVCRVLSYTVPANRLGLQRLYEIWGWTGESQAWLYAVVTPELPAGFPMGNEVSERATCYGYFFKVQGYLEAGAAPRAKPLPAPLLLGRLEWNPHVQPRVAGNETNWIVGISVIAGALLASRLVFMATQKRRGSRAAVRRSEDAVTAEQWLAGIQRAGPANTSQFSPEGTEPDREF